MEKKNGKVIRVAIIGPESTAKSTISKELAEHYQTLWIKEYSRMYLNIINRKYNLDDILAIAKQQLMQEKKEIPKANKLIFIDTELIISKVWCLDVFNTCPEWITDNIVKYKYDFYLLMYPDIEWRYDKLRENPYRRDFFFDWYERELKAYKCSYTIIKGNGPVRLQNSIAAVEEYEHNN